MGADKRGNGEKRKLKGKIVDGYIWKNDREDGPMGWHQAYVGNTLMDCM